MSETDNHLALYDSARAALAKAVKVDEVKEIRDKAMALKAVAKIAKDRELEANAFELRCRAERRLGQMLEEGKADRAGRGERSNSFAETISKPTLKEIGIDGNLAHRARLAASLAEEQFEEMIAVARTQTRRSAERAAISKVERRRRHLEIRAQCEAENQRRCEIVAAGGDWRLDPPVAIPDERTDYRRAAFAHLRTAIEAAELLKELLGKEGVLTGLVRSDIIKAAELWVALKWSVIDAAAKVAPVETDPGPDGKEQMRLPGVVGSNVAPAITEERALWLKQEQRRYKVSTEDRRLKWRRTPAGEAWKQRKRREKQASKLAKQRVE